MVVISLEFLIISFIMPSNPFALPFFNVCMTVNNSFSLIVKSRVEKLGTFSSFSSICFISLIRLTNLDGGEFNFEKWFNHSSIEIWDSVELSLSLVTEFNNCQYSFGLFSCRLSNFSAKSRLNSLNFYTKFTIFPLKFIKAAPYNRVIRKFSINLTFIV